MKTQTSVSDLYYKVTGTCPPRRLIFVLVPMIWVFLAGCATRNHVQVNAELPHSKQNKATLESQSEESFYGAMKVKKYQLSNGLKVVILEDHSSPTFSYQTWFNVGSRDEQTGLTGLAHLFEHMMFKATKNNPDGTFDRLLEEAGAQNENAFTNRNYTAYVQSLPSNRLELIISLEADRMVNLIVDKNALDKEREVVKNERRMRTENSPDGMMYEKIYELAFRTHPYHWPVIGYEKDLDNATPEECLSFYKKHYAPNNAVIVITGDVHSDNVIKLVQRYYGHLQSQPLNHYNGPPEPPQKAPRATTLRLPLSVEKVFLGYRVPPQTHPDAAAVEILGNIIGHTQTSRLYKKLVDTGLASAVDAFYDSGKDDSLFIIVANMQKGKSAETAARVINQEVSRLVSGGVSQAELKAALNRYKFDLYSTLESNFSKARHIGFLETVMGSTQAGTDLLKQMEKLTPLDINHVARRYFLPTQSTKIIGKPRSAKI